MQGDPTSPSWRRSVLGVFIGGTDVEAEPPILWPPDVESWPIWKDPDGGKDWGWEEKGTAEDQMTGWHHQHNGHGFGWTLGVGDGHGGLACCSSWGCKVCDTTERLNWTELICLFTLTKPFSNLLQDYQVISHFLELSHFFSLSYTYFHYQTEIFPPILKGSLTVLRFVSLLQGVVDTNFSIRLKSKRILKRFSVYKLIISCIYSHLQPGLAIDGFCLCLSSVLTSVQIHL